MLYSNYNVYILCYVDTMLSTYYYIYILVDTYYVINGITIVKYLHTVNPHNGGKGCYIATPCPIVKGAFIGVYRHAMRRTMRAIRYWLGQRVRRELTMREIARVSIDWVWDWFGVCPIRFLHQKKYVFSGMLVLSVVLSGLMGHPCGDLFFRLYCPTWIGGCK